MVCWCIGVKIVVFWLHLYRIFSNNMFMQASTKPVIWDSRRLVSASCCFGMLARRPNCLDSFFNVFSRSVHTNAATCISYVTMCWSLNSTVNGLLCHILVGVCSHGTAIPLQAWTCYLGQQEVEVPKISQHSTHEGGKVVSPTHHLPLPPRKYSWYSFLSEAESAPAP